MSDERLTLLRAAMRKEKLDGMLVSTRTNALYLSRFSSSNCVVLVTRRDAFFLTDFRYIEKATQQISGYKVLRMTQNATGELRDLIRKVGVKRLGFEGGITYDQFKRFKKAAGRTTFIEAGNILRELRSIKEPAETKQIAKNQKLNQALCDLILQTAQPGETEFDIQRKVRRLMFINRVEEAFETIAATGQNTSLPHATPGKTKIRTGDYLLIDMGVRDRLYHSDLTRTACVGEASPQHREVYEIVKAAQIAALKKIRPGALCKDVDAAARTIISDAGYGEQFGHGLGHGVGLEIHEAPTLNPRSEEILREGMVVTVEPGIYIPGFGGVRIEDLVVVTKKGFRNLTTLSKDLRLIS
ncbi:MAG: M24 family metallopeptidase [Candidatus Sumerlaeaceae bacterium]